MHGKPPVVASEKPVCSHRCVRRHDKVTTRCCMPGAVRGMMAGLLLARAGVDTIVLEKHGDFLRDSGDTVHPRRSN